MTDRNLESNSLFRKSVQQKAVVMDMEKTTSPVLKKSWQRAWNLGKEYAKRFDDETSALNAMPMDELEDFACIDGFSEFFRAGFTGREPEWVEAIRYGDIPKCGYSINYADNKREPGVSCIRIIRKQGDEDYNSVYDVTLGIGDDRDKIRIHGWYLGGVGSDGEPCIWIQKQ